MNRSRILASTSDSVLAYDWAAERDPGPACGYWALLRDGQLYRGGQARSTRDFSEWDLVARTASTVLIYIRSDGTADRVTLLRGSTLIWVPS